MENDNKIPKNINIRNQNKPESSGGQAADMGFKHEYSNQSTTAHHDHFSFLRVPSHQALKDDEAINENIAEQETPDEPLTEAPIIRATRIA